MSTNNPDPRPARPERWQRPSAATYRAHPDLPAPRGNAYASACWLIARHPVLSDLAGRVPGVVDYGGDIRTCHLARAVNDFDEHTAAWQEHERTYPAPHGDGADDARHDAWLAAGPAPTARVEALAAMSHCELTCLRLLAMFSAPAGFCVSDLDGVDPTVRDVLGDWMVAVLAFHADPVADTSTPAQLEGTAS